MKPGVPLSSGSPVKLQSGVRKYAKDTLWHKLRRAWRLRGTDSPGKGIFVEQNVRLLRHPENICLGDRIMLKEGSRLCPTNQDAHIEIGAWTTIGYHTYIFANSRISIGANCLVAPFCYLVDINHGISKGQLIREQAMTAQPISVGNDVWLGTGVVVTSGVTISDGAIIGAGSVVTKDIPENAIAAGNPAVVIRFREE